MVTALRPEEFLLGARGNGRALPHATVRIGDGGVIFVGGDSLFRGYFPEWRDRRPFATGDLGRLDATGHLHVLGRRDAVIVVFATPISRVLDYARDIERHNRAVDKAAGKAEDLKRATAASAHAAMRWWNWWVIAASLGTTAAVMGQSGGE